MVILRTSFDVTRLATIAQPPHSKNIKLMLVSKGLFDIAHKNAATAKSSSEVELQAFQNSSKIWFAQTGKRYLRMLKNTLVLINFSTKYSR